MTDAATTGTESVPERRGPGRPPDMIKRRAVLDATLELLAEVGYGSLTIDAVAQRAGSNRALIYRVWDSKVALVGDALFGSVVDLVVPDTGSVAEDLRLFTSQQVERMHHPAYIMGVPGLTVELLTDPAVFRDANLRYIEPSVAGFRTILERGLLRGDIAFMPDPRVFTFVTSGTTTGLAQGTRLSVEQITDLLMDMFIGGLLKLRSKN